MPRDANGMLTPGRLAGPRRVPAFIPRPDYVGRGDGPFLADSDVYDAGEIERIRAAGRVAAEALAAAGAAIRPGVTTAELDGIVHEHIVAAGAYPSTLGYRGFPASCCTSINEVICHGIPDDTELVDGDIVNLDVTAYLDGMHGDLNRTFLVGSVSEPLRLLVERTEEAMRRGIRAVAVGRQVNVIGRAIESYANRFGYGVVRDFTGHGVGRAFHTGLVIPHYDEPRYDTVIQPGMVFTIEPMLTLGSVERPGAFAWELWDDGWTVVTADRAPSAQFEHTLVVTETGTEILTLPRDPEGTTA